MEDSRGLTGSSGYISPTTHISASYSCNDMVFVSVIDEEYGIGWQRINEQEANEKGLEIIKCSKCNKRNATSLDHYYPYYIERNMCDVCLTIEKIKRRKSMSVAKKDLVKVVAVDCGMTLKNAEAAVDSIFGFIKGAVKDGDSVMLKGFGKFSRVVRAARTCKTPLGNVNKPKRYAMKFHASGNFQDEIEKIEIVA